MIFSLKTFSRSVHEEEQPENKPEIIQAEEDDHGGFKSLTVWRKSLIVSCHGFTVFDSNGDLVFRVDNYSVHPHELTLMDGSGKSVLTLRKRKRLGIVESWMVCEGETTTTTNKPVWCVRKQYNNIFPGNQSAIAHVFRGESGRRRCEYVVEGSYAQRSCKVLDKTRRVVAEMRMKEAINGSISFGVDVFVLSVHQGFHPGYAMALVLVLDQMFS